MISIQSSDSPVSRPVVAAIICLLIVAICGVYLFTINGGIPADGTDWAMYVMHARNIATGHPYAETNYINQPEPKTGANTYPSGYPLLLAPVYAVTGFDLYVFKVITDVVLALSLWPTYIFMRRYVSFFESLLILVVLSFSYEYLTTQNNIGSDALYQLVSFATLLLVLWIYDHDKHFTAGWKWGMFAGVLCAATYLIRPIGIALPLAIGLFELMRRKTISRFLIAMGVAFVPLVILNNLLFHKDAGYSDQFIFSPILMMRHAESYVGYFSYLFTTPILQRLRYILWPPTLVLAIMGLWIRWRRNGITIVEIYGAIVLFVLFVYHMTNPRYLLPLLPLYLAYMMVAAREGLKRLPVGPAFALRAAGVAALLVTPAVNLWTIHAYDTDSLITLPAFEQVCNEVKKRVGPHEYMVFWNPRVLALYTNRPASAYPAGTPAQIANYLERIRPNYVLFEKSWEEDRRYLEPVVKAAAERYTTIYENEGFRLIQIIGSPDRRSDPPVPIVRSNGPES